MAVFYQALVTSLTVRCRRRCAWWLLTRPNASALSAADWRRTACVPQWEPVKTRTKTRVRLAERPVTRRNPWRSSMWASVEVRQDQTLIDGLGSLRIALSLFVKIYIFFKDEFNDYNVNNNIVTKVINYVCTNLCP